MIKRRTNKDKWCNLCVILHFEFVVASAAEAELGAQFLNAQEGAILLIALHEFGQKQPSASTHWYNVTATCIANNTVKEQYSEQVIFGEFDVQ
jgi:hypothetical protein